MKNQKDGVAIIGMSFKFPGVNHADDLWAGLLAKKIFYERHDPYVKSNPNLVNAWGGVNDPSLFDYRFFNYSFREACYIDPQQRLLLEHSWHAMEAAGYMFKSMMPTTAVYASASINRYLHSNLNCAIESDSEDDIVIGNLADFLATRIAYKLGLTGPALTIQCGCSSGLAALHQARIALLTGQAEMALIGAVSLSAPNDKGYRYQPDGIRSKDGLVRPFDNAASGTVFTNGVVALVLKPLSHAIKDADNILGVIAASALSNDGSNKASFTAPSVKSQIKAIQKTLRISGIKADQIALVEAHGTGTIIGDPIEFSALNYALSEANADSCALQSIKANLGHLDTASGLAGVIKACLVLKNRIIPPQTNFSIINSAIPLRDSPFFINDHEKNFPPNKNYVGINALGIGGTNAHVLLTTTDSYISHSEKKLIYEQSENVSENKKVSTNEGLLLLSAASRETFSELIENYQQATINDYVAAARTTQLGRTSFSLRKSIYLRENISLKEQLSSINVDAAKNSSNKLPVYLFPGQGAQFPKMGGKLYRISSIFRQSFDKKLAILEKISNKNYKAAWLDSNNEVINLTCFTQPILLAFEVALAEYLHQLNALPCALLGHSLGEYAALVVSQAIEFEVAARLVIARANLMSKTKPGAMCSVIIDKEQLMIMMPNDIDIAALNAPNLFTLSGPLESVNKFFEKLEREKIHAQMLKVSHAFHSHLLDPILDDYANYLDKVKFYQPTIPIVSSKDGKELSYDQIKSPRYWQHQMRYPVNFIAAVQTAYSDFSTLMVEAGPGTVLQNLSKQILASQPHEMASIMAHPLEQNRFNERLYQVLGLLWEHGSAINWAKVSDEFSAGKRLTLPLTPLKKARCWIEEATSQAETKKLSLYRQTWSVSFDLIQPCEKTKTENWLVLHGEENGLENHFLEALSQYVDKITVKTIENLLALKDISLNVDENKHNVPINVVILFRSSKKEVIPFCQSLLILQKVFQIFIAKYSNDIRRVIIVTQSATALQSVIDPANAALTTAVKTLNQEYGNLSPRLIDIAGEFTHPNLIEELFLITAPPIVVLRQGERFVESFEELIPNAQHHHALNNQHLAAPYEEIKHDKKTAVIIFGGSGYIGLQYAEMLAINTPHNIYLAQRTILNSSDVCHKQKLLQLNKIKQLAPGRIFQVQCDVREKDQVLSLGKKIACNEIIDTVIISAGVDASMHYRFLKDTDDSFCFDSFNSKISGLINVAELAKQLTISHCHVVSSIASNLGGIGMFVYGALHACLDALSTRYEKNGLFRWSRLNWEAWEFNTDSELPEEFGKNGFGSHLNSLAIQPSDGQYLLKEIWSSIQGNYIVSNVNLAHRYRQWVNNHRAIDLLAKHKDVHFSKAPRPELQNLYVGPDNKTEEMILAIWSELLAIKGIGINDNFFALGGHSLLALKMINKINSQFQSQISIVDIFEYPTVGQLSQYLLGNQKATTNLNVILDRVERRKQSQALFKKMRKGN